MTSTDTTQYAITQCSVVPPAHPSREKQEGKKQKKCLHHQRRFRRIAAPRVGLLFPRLPLPSSQDDDNNARMYTPPAHVNAKASREQKAAALRNTQSSVVLDAIDIGDRDREILLGTRPEGIEALQLHICVPLISAAASIRSA